MDSFVLSGSGLLELSFSLQKRMVTKEHRRECYSLVQGIFGCGQSLDGDFIVINFFALVLSNWKKS
jgi:hypothetical protein